MYESDNERTSQGIDSLLNFETVKYYGAEKYEVDVYCKAILEQQKNDSFSFGSSCVADMAKNIVICSSLLASSLLCAYLIVEEGTLTAGQYVLFSTYIIELYSPISDFGWMYGYVVGIDNSLTLRLSPSIFFTEFSATFRSYLS